MMQYSSRSPCTVLAGLLLVLLLAPPLTKLNVLPGRTNGETNPPS